MSGWQVPAIILSVVVLLIIGNVVEFAGKRRADAAVFDDLEAGTLPERLALKQCRQTQNIEQLLHVISTLLFAILVTLLWN